MIWYVSRLHRFRVQIFTANVNDQIKHLEDIPDKSFEDDNSIALLKAQVKAARKDKQTLFHTYLRQEATTNGCIRL